MLNPPKDAPDEAMSPPQIRSIFGDNLRLLLKTQRSIANVCKAIGVHRSQFNRYMNGEAFPKPDVLHRICMHFETDARILLEPIDAFEMLLPAQKFGHSLSRHPETQDFFQISATEADTSIMPCGFYRYFRHSYIYRNVYQSGLNYVYLRDGQKFMKGYMHRMVAKELSIRIKSSHDREFRGPVVGTDTGVVCFAAHRNSRSFTMNYLEIRTVVEKTFLFGYSARTMSKTGAVPPISNIIFEHIPAEMGHLCTIARNSGFVQPDNVPALYRELLADT